MIEAIQTIQAILEPLGEATRVLLEALSVFTVLYGLIAIAQQSIPHLGRRLPGRPSIQARLTFGSWLALALEFQLAADIVATTTNPSESNLIQLAVIALIRTFLNLFLSREIETEQRLEEQAAGRWRVATPPKPSHRDQP